MRNYLVRCRPFKVSGRPKVSGDVAHAQHDQICCKPLGRLENPLGGIPTSASRHSSFFPPALGGSVYIYELPFPESGRVSRLADKGIVSKEEVMAGAEAQS